MGQGVGVLLMRPTSRIAAIVLMVLVATAAERLDLVAASAPGGVERKDPAPPKAGPQEVDVVAVMPHPQMQSPLVVLQRRLDGRQLWITIGFAEATGIAIPLQGATPPRPLTHDLFLTLFGRLNVTLKRVVITDLRNDTYYATVYLAAGATEMTLDARPSDAIALAIRARVPVLVEDRVFEKSGPAPATPRRPSI